MSTYAQHMQHKTIRRRVRACLEAVLLALLGFVSTSPVVMHAGTAEAAGIACAVAK